MPRLLDDWIGAFLDYTDHMESPRLLRSWSAISTIASALRRKVWFDMEQFVWSPSLYIVFVGPPGVLTKSITTDLASNLLREIPGIKFGPNNITWQALVTAFAGASESFEYPIGSGNWNPMSPITLISRELGSLLNPKDQDIVNLFIELYDGSKNYQKTTKGSGNDSVEYPWANLMGATTPSWIASNVPQSALGSGLISRIIFLYGDEKEKLVAYPKRVLRNREAHALVRKALIHDLEHVSLNLCGPYELTEEAAVWGEEWYTHLWTGAKDNYTDDKVMGYIARKQAHLHKVAMVLSASKKDELLLTLDDLQLADQMLSTVEGSLELVFSQIGRSDQSRAAQKFIDLVHRKGRLPYEEAYRLVHSYFPDFKNFEGILEGAIRSGVIQLVHEVATGRPFLQYVERISNTPHNGTPNAPNT